MHSYEFFYPYLGNPVDKAKVRTSRQTDKHENTTSFVTAVIPQRQLASAWWGFSVVATRYVLMGSYVIPVKLEVSFTL